MPLNPFSPGKASGSVGVKPPATDLLMVLNCTIGIGLLLGGVGLTHLVLITVRLPEAEFEWGTIHAIERTQRVLYKFIEATDGYTFERQDRKGGDL